MISIERAYSKQPSKEGKRFLVDRIWPRGIKKEQLDLDGWLKEVAPTNQLRRWFGHDPEKWEAFQQRYHKELDAHPEAWQPLLEEARQGDVILIYGARDTEHNQAVALKAYLDKKLKV